MKLRTLKKDDLIAQLKHAREVVAVRDEEIALGRAPDGYVFTPEDITTLKRNRVEWKQAVRDYEAECIRRGVEMPPN